MATTQPTHSETSSPWHFELRHRLALTLEVAGMSVQEMADHLGVSANTVGNYTSGRTTPKRPTLVMWAIRTGAPIDWIMTGEEESSPKKADALGTIHNMRPSNPLVALHATVTDLGTYRNQRALA